MRDGSGLEDASDGCGDEVRPVHRHEGPGSFGPDDVRVEQGGDSFAVAVEKKMSRLGQTTSARPWR